MSTHDPLTTAVAAAPMRTAHFLWHTVRDVWLRLSAQQQADFTARFGPSWVPPRPSRDAAGQPIIGQGAGLDFLGMHRGMIAHARMILGQNAGTRLDGWPTPPAANDPDYPVPRGYRLPEPAYPSKNDANWAGLVSDTLAMLLPDNLRKVSLDELGSRLEHGIHAAMHERFGGYGSNNMLRTREPDPFVAIDPKWNDPAYDSLLDAYAAHVNPWFWRIHGWIDAQIGAWEVATGQTADFSGCWSGPMPHHHPMTTHTSAITPEHLTHAAAFLGAAGHSGLRRRPRRALQPDRPRTR